MGFQGKKPVAALNLLHLTGSLDLYCSTANRSRLDSDTSGLMKGASLGWGVHVYDTRKKDLLDMMIPSWNPNTWEIEAGGCGV